MADGETESEQVDERPDTLEVRSESAAPEEEAQVSGAATEIDADDDQAPDDDETAGEDQAVGEEQTQPVAPASSWASPEDLLGWLAGKRAAEQGSDDDGSVPAAEQAENEPGVAADTEDDTAPAALSETGQTGETSDIDEADETDDIGDETDDDAVDVSAVGTPDEEAPDDEEATPDDEEADDEGATDDEEAVDEKAVVAEDAVDDEAPDPEIPDAEAIGAPDTSPIVLPGLVAAADETEGDAAADPDAEHGESPERSVDIGDLPADTQVVEAPSADTQVVEAPADTPGEQPEPAEAPPEGGAPEPIESATAPRLGRRLVSAGAAVIVLLGLGTVGAAAFAEDLVPRGTTVGGVDVGGLRRGEAVQRLADAAQSASTTPVTVTVDDREASIDPVDAGLGVNAERSIDAVLGGRVDLVRMWRQLTGGAPAPSLPEPDQARLRVAVEAVAEDTNREAVDGAVEFGADGPRALAATTGVALDVDAATDAVVRGWLARTGPLELPVTVVQPRITQAEVDRAMTEDAEPAASGPITVVLGAESGEGAKEKTVSVTEAALLPTLSMTSSEQDPGRLDVAVDGTALSAALLAGDETLQATPKDARIILKDGVPQVVPSADGVKIDPVELAAVVREALADPERTARLESSVVRPELTTEKAETLGVKERVSTFSTNLTANVPRTNNLRIAARTVNGTLVLPGETFSLNGVLGRRTAAKGYSQAPVIYDGRLAMDYGGGVSQMATTIFNNVFFAGLEDVRHMPHSFYISRYPEGREATVDYPSVDLVWRNDSPYGVLVQASVGSQVTVSFWSTKQYDDVQAIKSARRNIRQPKTIYDESDGCVAQAPSQGFDVTVRRKVVKDGKTVKDQSWNTTYIAEDTVICGAKPKPKATPSPSASPPDLAD